VASPKQPRPDVAGPAPFAAPVPAPAPMWYASGFAPDGDLRVQALGGLMRIDPDKAIPMLAELAFEADKPMTANRAVLVLSQSPLPKARQTVVRVARDGPEPVRVFAVRYLAQFGGRQVSEDLMQVFVTANEPVKWQIVKSLGELEQSAPLIRIIQSEKDGTLRSKALTSLGRAGGAAQLFAMYRNASFESKRSIIDGLFTARADTQLIRVAEIERSGNSELRREAVQRLALLDTPQAADYVKRAPLPNSSEKR
jgi:HEAT repeat protein